MRRRGKDLNPHEKTIIWGGDMKLQPCLPMFLKYLVLICTTGAASAAPLTFEIPNFDPDGTSCHVKIPAITPGTHCTADACEMPAPAGSTLGTIRVNFSCLPKSAPTGFENPPDYARVESIRSMTSSGHISQADSIDEPADQRWRDLIFCLYGKAANFCGAAKTLLLKDGSKADSSAAIKQLIRHIDFR